MKNEHNREPVAEFTYEFTPIFLENSDDVCLKIKCTDANGDIEELELGSDAQYYLMSGGMTARAWRAHYQNAVPYDGRLHRQNLASTHKIGPFTLLIYKDRSMHLMHDGLDTVRDDLILDCSRPYAVGRGGPSRHDPRIRKA